MVLTKFYKKSFVLIILNITTVGIYFLSQPFLRKIYTPEEFGYLDLIVKTSTIISVFLSLRIEKLIPSEREISELKGIILTLIISSTFTLLIIAFLITPLIKDNIIIKGRFVILGIAALIAVNQVLKLETVDKGETKKFGISSLIKRTAEIFCNLSFIKHGLIPGEIIGNLLSLFYLGKNKSWNYSIKKLKSFVKNNFMTICYNFLPEAIITFSVAIPSLVIYNKLNLIDLGLFEFAEKFTLLPVILISNPIGIIVLDFFSKEALNNVFLKLLKITLFNFIISICIGATIYFSIDILITYFFDIEWSSVSDITKSLILLLILRVTVAPLGQILVAKRYLKSFAMIQVVKLILLLSLFLFDYSDLSDFIYHYIISQSIFYIFMLFSILIILKKNESSTDN